MSSTTADNNGNTTASTEATTVKPQTIGVFGGSFNPIHLGHALLAITTQQTCPVDAVVLVPVFQHAVKRDLLPFEDRVAMCTLAVAPFGSALSVSTVEQETGKSNGAMLRALKSKYPKGTKFVWICGDDFFRWMDRPAGLDTIKEVSGLIVQRRLHKEVDMDSAGNSLKDGKPRFFKEPVDETKIRAVMVKMDLDIHFIYGELPHFSSSLVRRAPGHWRSFLTQTVVQYLDARPHLLEQLLLNLKADADHEEAQKQHKIQKTGEGPSDVSTRSGTGTVTGTGAAATSQTAADTSVTAAEEQLWQDRKSVAAASVMRGMEAVHALQGERGRTGLYLSVGQTATTTKDLTKAQADTDALVQEILRAASASSTSATDTTAAAADTSAAADTDNQDMDQGQHDLVSHDESQSSQTQNSNTNTNSYLQGFDEGLALDEELQRIPVWLSNDRRIVQKRCRALTEMEGVPGWLARLTIVQKFDTRIDVLMQATVRALTEILDFSHHRSVGKNGDGNDNGGGGINGGTMTNGGQEAVDRDLPELLFKWCEVKEALGRLRAFVCAGGPSVPMLVHSSLKMRERVNQTIDTKERSIARVLSLEAGMSSRLSAPDALSSMLEDVTLWEWSLMGGFASSTPLALVHKLLDRKEIRSAGGVTTSGGLEFDVVKFFDSSSSAIDFLLTFAKALAASACARA